MRKEELQVILKCKCSTCSTILLHKYYVVITNYVKYHVLCIVWVLWYIRACESSMQILTNTLGYPRPARINLKSFYCYLSLKFYTLRRQLALAVHEISWVFVQRTFFAPFFKKIDFIYYIFWLSIELFSLFFMYITMTEVSNYNIHLNSDYTCLLQKFHSANEFEVRGQKAI